MNFSHSFTTFKSCRVLVSIVRRYSSIRELIAASDNWTLVPAVSAKYCLTACNLYSSKRFILMAILSSCSSIASLTSCGLSFRITLVSSKITSIYDCLYLAIRLLPSFCQYSNNPNPFLMVIIYSLAAFIYSPPSYCCFIHLVNSRSLKTRRLPHFVCGMLFIFA